VLKAASALGFTTVMWSITGFDWSAKSSEPIVRKVTEQIEHPRRPRSEIVLLHDGGHLAFGVDRGFTVQATEAILTRYSSTKKFVAVPELTQS